MKIVNHLNLNNSISDTQGNILNNSSLFMTPVERIVNPEIFNENGKLRSQQVKKEKFESLMEEHQKR